MRSVSTSRLLVRKNSSIVTSHCHMYVDSKINHLVYRTLVGLFVLYQQSNLLPEFPTYSANAVLAGSLV